ncbi:high mobility group protein [Echinococcus multilocularis]|uniref:High mobility group protein n=1 Tax=Echinococcus multilocularis TaxID=6211 RepID=A0A068YD26_ECHMU|nr:high mobility group protein [Echinococcus multilocularis]
MRVKDKNRPKSPLSGFACFVQVIRDKHRSLHPNENVIFNEFAKRCAERWREMPPDKRIPFEEMSRLDTKRYNREMGEYVQQQQLQQQQQLLPQPMMHTQQQQSQPGGQQSTFEHHHHHMRGTKRRRLKDPSMPKRALSAFFFFCDHYRSEVRNTHPEWRVSEVAKELGRLWDECPDKAPYELQAQKDKRRYEEEMRRYKDGTFVTTPKRLRDISAKSGGGAIESEAGDGGGGIGVSSANVNVANCFEIEGSREVDEMDGKGGEDDIDDEEDVDDYEEEGDEEEEEEGEEEEDDDADAGADEEVDYEELEKGAIEKMDEDDDAQNEGVEAESGVEVGTTPTSNHHHNQRQPSNAFSVAYVVSDSAHKGESGVVDEDVRAKGTHGATVDEGDDD